MAERKKIDLSKLGVKDPQPQVPRYAELAHASAANAWQPGKKLYLSKHAPVPMSPELQRVLDLPRRPTLDLQSAKAEILADMMTARWSRGERKCACATIDPKIAAGKRKCIKRLKPVQAWALYEMGIVGGLLAHIPVGSGKTLIDILSPLALAQVGVRHSLLLVPPSLLVQLERDYRLIREHFQVPQLYVASLEKRHEVAGAPKLHVLPYSRLSHPTSSSWIRELQPDAIIADECDKLRDPDGAGSSRVLRYFLERGDTRFCGWTGSLTDSSIVDYCLEPKTRVLTRDLRWVRIDSVKPGDQLIGFDEEIRRTRLRPATVEGVKVLTRPRIRITTDRGIVVCSDKHQWIQRGRATNKRRNLRGKWVEAKDVAVGDTLAFYTDPWDYDETREAGYIAGLLDGEGWVGLTGQVGFAQKAGLVLERFKQGLKDRGFSFAEYAHPSGVFRIMPNGDCAHIRTLGVFRPSRLLEKADKAWNGKEPSGIHTRHAKVLAVESLPPGQVIAVQTDIKTFIAEGFLSHNCHLAALALRMQSPLPIDKREVAVWARALDDSENPGPPGELARFCVDDEESDIEKIREGFGQRLAETQGIVISTEASIDIGITITERPAPAIPEIIERALHMVRAMWVRPDTLIGEKYDEELVDPFQVAKVARELASGIFYRWRFDPINGVPQKQTDIDEWRAARKDFNCELRQQLKDREEWLDSPNLCEHAAQRFHGQRPKRPDRPEWNSSTWLRWSAIKDKVKHTTQGCRVSDYLVKDAAEWARTHLGIVWYGMVEFGEWVAHESGCPLHGGGPKAGELLEMETGNRTIIASIKSHGRGRDGLQALYSDQLIAQIPTSATMWEQVLGRLHRQGQDAAEVRAEYYAHTDEISAAMETALGRAGYIKGTLRAEQKILIGTR